MVPHSSIRAWRISWTEMCGGLQFPRFQSQMRLSVRVHALKGALSVLTSPTPSLISLSFSHGYTLSISYHHQELLYLGNLDIMLPIL